MALQLFSGISVFLFVIFIPCGFAAKIQVDVLNSDGFLVSDSLQTRHEGILREPSLTASAVREKVKVKNNKIATFLVRPGFPFETSASLEIPQHSMQIPRKSRSNHPTRSSSNSGKVRQATSEMHEHHHHDAVVANGKIIVDSGAIPQASILGHVVVDANTSKHERDCNPIIITKEPNQKVLHKEGSVEHQNSLRQKRSISPPFLFLSILMDYSSPNDEENETSLDNRRPRTHRSFRTFGPEQGYSGKDQVELQEQQKTLPLSGQNLVSGGDGVRAHNASYIENASSPAAAVVVSSASSSCPVGHFECTNNPSLCVPQSAICNGKPECPGASDEYECGKVYNSCHT